LPPLQSVTPSHPEENCGEKRDFETSQQDPCDVSEIPETTNISAACDGVTDQNPPIDGENEKNAPGPPIKGNGADPSPPGADTDRSRRRRYRTLGQVAEIIREIHRQHPHWSVKRIAQTTGQPEERVRRALAAGSAA